MMGIKCIECGKFLSYKEIILGSLPGLVDVIMISIFFCSLKVLAEVQRLQALALDEC